MASTQALAVALGRTGAPPGTLVVAGQQSAGRGRLEHDWLSPPGGLYLSLILSDPPYGRSLVPMALGVAVADALAEYGVRPSVKWPNDLLLVGADGTPRKVAGVLVDRLTPSTGPPVLVAGVGVNVASAASAYPESLRSRVVQLTEIVDRPVTPADVEARVVPRLLGAVESLSTREGWRRVAARCRAALFGRGRKARVDGRAVGTIGELGDDGSLWLVGDEGPVQVLSGELIVEGT